MLLKGRGTSLSSADSILKRPMASLMTSVSSRSGCPAVMLFLFSSNQSWKPVFGLKPGACVTTGLPLFPKSDQLMPPCVRIANGAIFHLLVSASSVLEPGGGALGGGCSAAGSVSFLLAVICSRVLWVWRQMVIFKASYMRLILKTPMRWTAP